jgi:hypothetical protein
MLRRRIKFVVEKGAMDRLFRADTSQQLQAERRLCYSEPDTISTAVGYGKFYSQSHDPVIRVYDEAN